MGIEKCPSVQTLTMECLCFRVGFKAQIQADDLITKFLLSEFKMGQIRRTAYTAFRGKQLVSAILPLMGNVQMLQKTKRRNFS